jgi:(1->4)-alpha-D-glucan 1-alpha-D-glucosylmutase
MGEDGLPVDPSRPEISTPTATYRLQFHGGFTFRDAERLVPYLHSLGVSHVYCSPYLKARAGSAHGYDITDHNALNPEVGDEEAFSAFVEALHRHGMGQILDFVPNHVGIGGHENRWWLDVLEYGQSSPYAEFFDIDWEPAKAELRRKVLLPFLGDHYGQVLERGELELRLDSSTGTLSVWYHEHRFPIAPRTYARVLGSRLWELERRGSPGDARLADLIPVVQAFHELAPPGASARRRATLRQEADEAKAALAALVRAQPAIAAYIEGALREINGSPGHRKSFQSLHRLLETQHYRLAFWRVAADEINYRRFFDINDLAGLRMEREDLFDLTHRRLFDWAEEGQVHGVRIDHVDGLSDPKSYCQRIRQRFPDRPLYLIVEKILAPHEKLRPDWPVDGTTGYEFLNLVNGLFVDSPGERPLDQSYERFAGRSLSFDDILHISKKNVMNFLLGSELQVLANQLDRIAESDWRTRDFTLNSVKEALKDIIACFPVYRTYVSAVGTHPDDQRDIEWAVQGGRKRSFDPEPSLFQWIQQILAGDLLRGPMPYAVRREVIRFITKFQQYTSPVMAKALEDTSFYRYHRLVSLNEVGGDPRRFGISLEDFHAANEERAARWPRAMLTTSTHDTKRSEDVRARINVLSEIPEEWEEKVQSWTRLNRRFKELVDGQAAPTTNHEYLLYQTLMGSWPVEQEIMIPEELPGYRERIDAYMIKAAREGKESSSWHNPDAAYEKALSGFVQKILDPSDADAFLGDLLPFASRIAQLGATNSLSQLLLKLTAPGIPDIYRGCELWDLSLVDPDNRRPVDYENRARLLSELKKKFDASDPRRAADVRALAETWWDGRLKLLLTWKLLEFRREHRELFLEGSYRPLSTRGDRARNVCAFAREDRGSTLMVASPRLCARLERDNSPFPLGRTAWGDTMVSWPGNEVDLFQDIVTGHEVPTVRRQGFVEVPVAELFADLPIAALVPLRPDSREP